MSRARDLFARITEGGYQAVINMIDNKDTEELFLDYKRSASNGEGSKFDNRDKSNLSKAISGFANSEGGIIVWGVDCRADPHLGDVPHSPMPLTNAIRFKSWLENAVSGATIPPHDGVQHEALIGPDGDSGFVVSLIPKGNHPPYQTVPDLSFKIRAGSNFAPVPRAVLAGMFGRYPQPEITPKFVYNQNPKKGTGCIGFEVGISLQNFGLGIASDVYLNVFAHSIGGSSCDLDCDEHDFKSWSHSGAFGSIWMAVLKSEYRLTPGAIMLPFTFRLWLRRPFNQDFKFDISAGASGSPPAKIRLYVPAAELAALFDAAEARHNEGHLDFGAELASRLLKNE